MENKVAVISIIVENAGSVEQLNALLHGYSEIIIGRMGIPYRARKLNIISIAVDAPEEKITSLTAAVSALDGVKATVAEA